jgi:hypothetical protein
MTKPNESFIGYVGPAGIHDGQIVAVERTGDVARVTLKSHGGGSLTVQFSGVRSLTMVRPVGMTVYALCEYSADSPWRRFVFANWDDEDDARLEIVALEPTFSA